MAGFSQLFCIRGEGGARAGDADSIYPPLCQVVVRDDDGGRQWLQPLYVMPGLGPLGMVRSIIPIDTDERARLLDACLAFFPGLLADCPSLPTVQRQLGRQERIDFGDASSVPAGWAQLRVEAKAPFRRLAIWEAALRRVQ